MSDNDFSPFYIKSVFSVLIKVTLIFIKAHIFQLSVLSPYILACFCNA